MAEGVVDQQIDRGKSEKSYSATRGNGAYVFEGAVVVGVAVVVSLVVSLVALQQSGQRVHPSSTDWGRSAS